MRLKGLVQTLTLWRCTKSTGTKTSLCVLVLRMFVRYSNITAEMKCGAISAVWVHLSYSKSSFFCVPRLYSLVQSVYTQVNCKGSVIDAGR